MRRFWQYKWVRRVRRGFRWIRILLMSFCLALLLAAIYVMHVGLPGFLKNPILAELKVRGFDVEVGRVRVHWFQGLLAEQLTVGRSMTNSLGQVDVPLLSIETAELRLDPSQLLHGKVLPDSLYILRGRLEWPLGGEPPAAPPLLLDRVTSELKFLPNDELELKYFSARFGDLRVHLSGRIAHASELKNLRSSEQRPRRISWPKVLRQAQSTWTNIHFSGFPELRLQVAGDARDAATFSAHAQFTVPEVRTQWGNGTDLWMSGHLVALTNAVDEVPPIHLDITLAQFDRPGHLYEGLALKSRALFLTNPPSMTAFSGTVAVESASTPWGSAGGWSGSFASKLSAPESDSPRAVVTDVQLEALQVITPWFEMGQGTVTGQVHHALSLGWPDRFRLGVEGRGTVGTNASLNQLSVQLEGDRFTNAFAAAHLEDELMGFWKPALPWRGQFKIQARELMHEKLQMDRLDVQGVWDAPILKLDRVEAGLYQGSLKAAAQLNISNRLGVVSGVTSFDVLKVAPLLNEGGRNWLGQFAYSEIPKLEAALSLMIPPWNQKEVKWQQEVRPTLLIDGSVQAGASNFRGIPVNSAQGRFSYSNLVWIIPTLQAERPEGQVSMQHWSSDASKEYYFRVRSGVDPSILQPVLTSQFQSNLLSEIQFGAPPQITASIWGRWHHPEETRFIAQVEGRDISFRGEKVARAEAEVEFEDRVLKIHHPRLSQGDQFGQAPLVTVDWKREEVRIEAGVGRWDPQRFVQMVGPTPAKVMEAYQFNEPPSVKVEGRIHFHEIQNTDLRFEVEGQGFAWWKFHANEFLGSIHWKGYDLILTNVVMDAYDGRVQGHSRFHFPKDESGTDLSFDLRFANSDLHKLMLDLKPGPNDLEGLLRGRLAIHSGNTEDLRNWVGQGQISVKEGRLWDIPIFGILSGPLNALLPGLGKSLADEGNATFVITNSVLYSKDLQVRAPLLRIEYVGSTDFDGRVNAKVEAKLIRDVPVIGDIFNVVLKPFTKLFEYKVTGKLSDPQLEPVHLPTKLVIKTLERIKGVFTFERGRKKEALPPAPPEKP